MARKNIGQAILYAAKKDVRMAEIEVQRNQQKLSSQVIAAGNGTRYTLTAPSNGVITNKNIAVGQVVDMTNIDRKSVV